MAINTTGTTANAWSPDLREFAPAQAVSDAIILQASTVAGEVQGDAPMLRVAYIDDAAAQFTVEGATIPESDPEFDEVLVATGKITQLVKLSHEQYEQDGTAEQLSASMQRAVIRKADEAFLAQPAPTTPAVTPPAGLLNINGIETGDAVTDNLDALIDLIATLEGNGSTPSHIILDPTGWASLRKIKTGTGSAAALLGAGTSDAARVLLDLPVLVTPALTAGTGLVLDRNAIVSAVGPVRVAHSDDAYFGNDAHAVRVTWRIGWNVVRPDRIGSFTVTAPAEA